MKVAYFLGGLNRGGAETLIHDICRQHEKVPYDFVCVYRHEGNMSDAFRETGAPLLRIPKKRGYVRYLRDIRRTLLREHVTIAHSQTASNTLLLAFALLGTGIPIITTFHGHMFADAPWWQRKIVYTASKKILCVSKYQKQYYEQKWGLSGENKLQVVYNGIDFEKFEVIDDRSIDNRWTQFQNNGRIRLCMVGNFIKGRSQIVVCRAIDIMKSQGSINFEFYFIGRKDEAEPWRYDKCECYCKEHHLSNVHFLGACEDVPALLKTMDGFVYSTEHDTFGIAVIEAIAAGVPVIVNDWDVMMEVTNNGKWATIYPTENAERLADEIDSLINHPAEYKKKSEKYAKQVREKYSIESHITNVNSIYKSL